MLVLSRHIDESIVVGDNIVITVVDIRGDKVRLGIAAPSDIPVHRREVYDAMQRENGHTPSLAGRQIKAAHTLRAGYHSCGYQHGPDKTCEQAKQEYHLEVEAIRRVNDPSTHGD